MSDKIELKEKLAAVDLGAKDFWKELTTDQQKALKGEFFILNRYISNVSGQSTEVQEHFVIAVNEYFNKHWNLLQRHPHLLWQLLSMCSHDSKHIFFHKWIGYKKKTARNNKILNFFLDMYPSRKKDEVELFVELTPDAELKYIVQQTGMDDKQVKALFKK